MKGWFLVLFLIITAGGSVLSAAAFFYIAKSQSKFVKILVFALCTLVIAIGVRFYEETYYSFYDMSYIKGLQYAAMAGIGLADHLVCAPSFGHRRDGCRLYKKTREKGRSS